MNEDLQTDGASTMPWPNSDPRARAPGSALPSDGEKAVPAAPGLLKTAVQGAHDTIDRMADRAAPAVRQFGDSVAAAEDALHHKSEQLRHTRDVWVEDARATVRGHPLASVAAAFALGAVIARLTR